MKLLKSKFVEEKSFLKLLKSKFVEENPFLKLLKSISLQEKSFLKRCKAKSRNEDSQKRFFDRPHSGKLFIFLFGFFISIRMLIDNLWIECRIM